MQAVKVKLAIAYAGLGAVALGIAVATQEFPPLRDWAPFAVVAFLTVYHAVEVNDHLTASPAAMIFLATAVAFGAGHAALGAAAISAVSPVTKSDIAERRVALSVINWGQTVVAAVLAGFVLEPFFPSGAWSQRDFPLVAAGAMLASMVYHLVNWGLVSLAVRIVYRKREVRPWSRMGSILRSTVVMGFVGGLLGATYHLVPVALPLIFALFGVGYLAFSSLSELREAQEATLRGFIKALEAKDLYTRGHTERVAYFSQLIAERMNYRGTRLERVRWAALIHDVGKLAVPRDLIRKRGRLEDGEYEQLQVHAHVVEDLLAEVEFLRPMVEIASGHHSRFDGGGYGGTGHAHGNPPSQEARILAVADAFDAMTSTRSYRVALSQEFAFQELRSNAGTQFDPEVVEALVQSVVESGERYGSPNLGSEQAARLIAEGKGRP